jgi:hypothetical protein
MVDGDLTTQFHSMEGRWYGNNPVIKDIIIITSLTTIHVRNPVLSG